MRYDPNKSSGRRLACEQPGTGVMQSMPLREVVAMPVRIFASALCNDKSLREVEAPAETIHSDRPLNYSLPSPRYSGEKGWG